MAIVNQKPTGKAGRCYIPGFICRKRGFRVKDEMGSASVTRILYRGPCDAAVSIHYTAAWAKVEVEAIGCFVYGLYFGHACCHGNFHGPVFSFPGYQCNHKTDSRLSYSVQVFSMSYTVGNRVASQDSYPLLYRSAVIILDNRCGFPSNAQRSTSASFPPGFTRNLHTHI